MGQLIDHDRLGANKVFSEMACEWNNPFQGESNLPPWEPRAVSSFVSSKKNSKRGSQVEQVLPRGAKSHSRPSVGPN